MAAQGAGTPSSTTVWSGVYSTAQAARGREVYEGACVGCHGEDLNGGDDGPALVGDGFTRHWLEDTLGAFFTKVQTQMPAGSPGSLKPNEYADLVAYMLQSNDYPAGTVEVTPDLGRLATIRIEGKNGPAPVPDFSLVQVVGCLTAGADKSWVVARGTEPTRVRDPGPSKPADLQAQEAKPLGTQAFQLLDVSPSAVESLRNSRVLAKGFLVRRPDLARLNVTWIGALAGACPGE